jgi:hypothetical protein
MQTGSETPAGPRGRRHPPPGLVRTCLGRDLGAAAASARPRGGRNPSSRPAPPVLARPLVFKGAAVGTGRVPRPPWDSRPPRVPGLEFLSGRGPQWNPSCAGVGLEGEGDAGHLLPEAPPSSSFLPSFPFLQMLCDHPIVFLLPQHRYTFPGD